MQDITKVDKNFVIQSKVQKEDVRFYNVDGEPFAVYGVYRDGDRYRRLPEDVARTVNEGVHTLHAHTAGGRVRFRTDSPYVAIHAETGAITRMSHFSLTGSAGFDLYVDTRYVKTFVPPYDMAEGFEGTVEFDTAEMREITIHFPLYSEVKALYIGLAETAAVETPTPYFGDKPIVYYGASVSQGGCASRPGMCYSNILSRRLHRDHVNLCFSGSALGEREIASYIKDLPMSLFVFAYDGNAPTPEYLAATHEPMFRIIREAQPMLPVIMMPSARWTRKPIHLQRAAIVETTYKNALAAGDRNVYFLDGRDLMALCGDEGTVDGTHPTDFGFTSIANALENLIREKKIFPEL